MFVRVILLEPEVPGNVGSIARSMRNFGLHDLSIVNPKTTLNGDARAFAMHGLPILESARIAPTLRQAIEDVDVVVGTSSIIAKSPSNLSRIAITPRQLAERTRKQRGVLGLVLGRESSGLSNQELDECDFMVTIPASKEYNVLNLATAASIIFYELFHEQASGGPELASQAAKKRLLAQSEHLTVLSGLQAHRRKLAQRAFRNVVSRSMISRREASLLIGLFRKACGKLGKLK